MFLLQFKNNLIIIENFSSEFYSLMSTPWLIKKMKRFMNEFQFLLKFLQYWTELN